MTKWIFITALISIFIVCSSFLWNRETRRDDVINQIEKMGKEIAKKENIQFLGGGSSGLIDAHSSMVFALNFVDRKPTSVDQARALAYRVLSEYWNRMKVNKMFIKFYNYNFENRPYLFQNPEVPKTIDIWNIGFKITFWDENIDRYQRPYVAQVVCRERKLIFYFADPKTQALVDPIEEEVDEKLVLEQD